MSAKQLTFIGVKSRGNQYKQEDVRPFHHHISLLKQARWT